MNYERDHKICELRNKFDTLAAKVRSCKGIEIQPVIKNVINKCHQPIITIGKLHKSRKIYELCNKFDPNNKGSKRSNKYRNTLAAKVLSYKGIVKLA